MTNANIACSLLATARECPGAPAVRHGDALLTYRELDEASGRLAALVRAEGVAPGDRVGLMLPNRPCFAVAYYGILRAGGVVVPLNTLLKEREIAYQLRDPEAGLLLAWHQIDEIAREGARHAGGVAVVSVRPGEFEQMLAAHAPTVEPIDRSNDDTAVILYTSGTTGKPKGAELTHANLADNVEIALSLFGFRRGDVVFGGLPLFHAFGQMCGMHTSIRAGATLSLQARFDARQALEIIQRDRVTVFEGVPTMYVALLNHPERDRFDVSSLRVCASGGAAMPGEVMRSFEAAFGCTVLEGYGLSETSPIASFNRSASERKVGSVGTPVDGVEMRIVDELGSELPTGEVGEIAVRGHNVMKGYWNRPEATAEAIDADGWFASGDLGRVDEDGYFFVVDRKKDMIIRGGYNVYPREIEDVLYEHPAVREAAVVGLAHDALGEEVGAAVSLRPGAFVTDADLRDFVKTRLAAYKYPRLIWFVDELPKGPTGKILKRELVSPSPAAGSSAAP